MDIISSQAIPGMGGTCNLPISRDDGEDAHHHHHHHHHHRSGPGHNHGNKVPYNGYNSEEYLDRLEPNGNIPSDKSNCRYGAKGSTSTNNAFCIR
uniref:Uncharacterized protein n=1 Tax=Megaselia scalaris TaxID=36166 RepID=T1GQD0_MEGSC